MLKFEVNLLFPFKVLDLVAALATVAVDEARVVPRVQDVPEATGVRCMVGDRCRCMLCDTCALYVVRQVHALCEDVREGFVDDLLGDVDEGFLVARHSKLHDAVGDVPADVPVPVPGTAWVGFPCGKRDPGGDIPASARCCSRGRSSC